MSHEIRTPLTEMLGYLEMLQREHGDLSGNDREDALQTVCRNTQHLLMLINDILDSSKIDTDRLCQEKRPRLVRNIHPIVPAGVKTDPALTDTSDATNQVVRSIPYPGFSRKPSIV